MSLSPLYLSETSDLHVSTAFCPPVLFPEPSTSCGKAHRFSGILCAALAEHALIDHRTPAPGDPPRGTVIRYLVRCAPCRSGAARDSRHRETPRFVFQDETSQPPRASPPFPTDRDRSASARPPTPFASRGLRGRWPPLAAPIAGSPCPRWDPRRKTAGHRGQALWEQTGRFKAS